MEIEKLFEAMDAAGIGRPRDEIHLGRYAPWQPIYRAYRKGRPDAEVLGQIPYAAQAMGKNCARTEAVLQTWQRKSAEQDAAKRARETQGNDLVTGVAFGFDSEAGQ